MASSSCGETHTIKYVEFLGQRRPIILQKDAGSCPLVAICNVLLLKDELKLSPNIRNVSQKKLLAMVTQKFHNKDAGYVKNPQQDIADLIPRLATGIDVNIKFKGISEFEFTRERVLFDLLKIPLYHGWIVDPKDSKTYDAFGSKCYNTIAGELVGLENLLVGTDHEKRPEEDSVDSIPATSATLGVPSPSLLRGLSFDVSTGSEPKKAKNGEHAKEAELMRTLKLSEVDFSNSSEDVSLDSSDARNVDLKDAEFLRAMALSQGKLIKKFLDTTASQLTVHGLICLRKELKERELCVLYCNYHLNTMFKFGGQLYLLVTDEGYKDQPNVVWEMLNEVNENTPLMTGSFKEFRPEDEYVSNTCIEQNSWASIAEHLACSDDAAHDNSGLVQVLKAMGNKKKKKQNHILNLIDKVSESDEEFKNFEVPIPERQVMIEEKFPLHLIDFNRPSIQWCCNNICTIHYGIRDAGEKGREWLNAWSNLYTMETVKPGREAFNDSPEEDQEKFLSLMLEEINKSRARIYYKKWKFALMKEEERKEEERKRFQSKGIDRTRLGGGEEEGGSGVISEEREEEEYFEKERDGVEGSEVKESEKERDEDKVEVDEDIAPLDPVNEVGVPLVDNTRLLKLRKSMGFSFILPIFRDNDGIPCYNRPFTLKKWFDDHESVESRWRPTVLNNSELDVVWNGDRLKRECLYLMHSLVIAVLDFHHDTGRPHGGLRLENHRNIKLFQYIQSVGGSQNVRFRIELPKPREIEDSEFLVNFAADMNEVKLMLKKILRGKPLHPEMDYLFTELLDGYPFSYKPWRTQLLRNFTGFWDGKSRAKFMVLLHYAMKSDMNFKERTKINTSVDDSVCISEESRPRFEAYRWVHRIPEGTYFHDVLVYDSSAQVEEPETTTETETTIEAEKEPKIEKDPEPQYSDMDAMEMIRYVRVGLHHNRERRGRGCGTSLDINEIEICMSNLFEGLILGAYTAMCRYNLFL